MRLCRAEDHKVMPWKNGGGSTTEMAIAPAGASLDNFDWRLSMARIEADGPFSSFPGIDRTLTLLDGKRVDLTVDGAPPVSLIPGAPTLRFAGESRVSSTVPEGPITDFNVMTRRTRCRHQLRRLDIGGRHGLAATAGTTILFVASGTLTAHGDDADADGVSLRARDCLILDPGGPRNWRLEAAAPTIVYRIDIT